MQSQVVVSKIPPLSQHGPTNADALRLPSADAATSSIVWLSYLGLISVAVAIMGW